MQIEVVKSKIHRVKVTGADLNYIGSITIDEALMEASNIIEGEKVSIVNINNGERLETYAIKGNRNSGEITLNGPAARKVQKGDIIIIISYGILDFEEAKSFRPSLVFPNENDNSLTWFLENKTEIFSRHLYSYFDRTGIDVVFLRFFYAEAARTDEGLFCHCRL